MGAHRDEVAALTAAITEGTDRLERAFDEWRAGRLSEGGTSRVDAPATLRTDPPRGRSTSPNGCPTLRRMVIQNRELSEALTKVRGHDDQKIQDAFLILVTQLDDLIAKVGEVTAEVDRIKRRVGGNEG